MIEAIRWYFLVFYAVGVVVLIVKVIPEGMRERAVETRPTGLWPRLANLLLPLECAVRLVGVGLGAYAAVFQLWASGALGRFLVPYAAIFEDHQLVTNGPHRFVRHPIYLGNVALFLGSALGTLNLYLLALWPLMTAGCTAHARFEERILRAKFGAAFDEYAGRTGVLVPKLTPRRERPFV